MISPTVGVMKPSSSIASVVLPLPDSPATVRMVGSSSLRVSEKSRNATVACVLITPRWYTFEIFLSSSRLAMLDALRTVEVARHLPAARQRHFLGTRRALQLLLAVGAARMESASRRQPQQRGRETRNALEHALVLEVRQARD